MVYLPPNPPTSSWPAFREWFGLWSGQDADSRLMKVGEAMEKLRPRLERAFLRVRRGFALLPKEAVCRDQIFARFLGLRGLPESEEAFLIWLQSQVLRAVHAERDAGISSLEGLNPAWDGLRNTIHRLPRVDRRTLLHALMPFYVDFSEAEANQGLKKAKELWVTVSIGVPAEAIPASWDTETLEETIRPRRAADLLSKGMFAGDGESAQRDRFLVGSLANTLYRFGLLTESKVSAPIPIILDPAILRVDAGEYVTDLRKWSERARSMLLDLGISEEILTYLDDLNRVPFGPKTFSSEDLLTMAGRLGFSKSDVLYSLGACAVRRGGVEKANRLFELGKKAAGSEEAIAVGLANQAVVAFEQSGIQLAADVLAEAHSISPWPRLVQENNRRLRDFLKEALI